MAKLHIKPIIFGFILGIAFFGIAPLGLGIWFIEYLKPILVPGIFLAQLASGDAIGLVPLIFAVFLNGIIYSIIILAISLVPAYLINKVKRL